MKILKKEYMLLFLIVLIYSIISFINLGSTKGPQTFWKTSENDEEMIVNLDGNYISKMRIFTGEEVGEYYLYSSKDGENFKYLKIINTDSVFTWNDYNIDAQVEYLKIVSKNKNASLGEIGFYDNENNLISLKSDLTILDEQNIIPDEISFLTNSYFDEVYFPRTAYEYINGYSVYEWTHPPLGKIIIALSIKLFGLSPFSYRLMGNIAGIMMIIAIYVLAKDLFKSNWHGTLAALILALDNLHFAQTRIGTVDSFLVLFILLSYMFMYKFVLLDVSDSLKKKMKMLFFSGIFCGFAIATKWSGCFSAIGLAIIFFAKIIISYLLYKNKNKNKVYEVRKTALKIIISCILFFVIIPVSIYVLSYIPDKSVSLSNIVEVQKWMYSYHKDLNATHPYSSPWYYWLIMKKPVLFYSNYYDDNTTSIICGMGNPIIWWIGLLAMVFVLIKALLKRKKEELFIVTAILVALIPQMGIGRLMFLYHYFPVIPFMICSIVYLLKTIEEKVNSKYISYCFIVIFALAFTYFYPVSSGLRVSTKYIQSTRWLDSWNY